MSASPLSEASLSTAKYPVAGESTPAFVRGDYGEWGFWAAFAIAYLLLPTRNYNGDGLALMQRLRETLWWENFDPNHFAWASLVDLALSVGRFTGLLSAFQSELFWLQALNGGVGLAVLWAMRQWCAELGVPVRASRLAVALAGCSFTMWHYATNVDMYIVVLLTLVQAGRAAWDWAQHPDARGPLWRMTLWLAGGLLIHQLVIVIAPVLLGAVWSAPGVAKSQRVRAIGSVLLGLLLLVGGPYVYVAEVLYRDSAQGGLQQYLFDKSAAGSGADWAPVKFAGDPAEWARVAALGHFNLSFWADDPALYYAFRQPEGTALFDRRIIAVGLPLLWLLGCGWWLWRSGSGPEGSGEVEELERWWRWSRQKALIWLAVGFGFTLVLNPGWAYYRLIYLPPLVLLTGQWLTESARHRVMEICLAIMIGWNASLGILPDSVWGFHPRYAQALLWQEGLSSSDLVIGTTGTDPLFIQNLRALTGIQRMVVSPQARVAFPARAEDRSAFQALSAENIDQFYERIFLEGELANQLIRQRKVRFHVRVAPSYELRFIELYGDDWMLGETLEGFGMPPLVSLHRRPGR